MPLLMFGIYSTCLGLRWSYRGDSGRGVFALMSAAYRLTLAYGYVGLGFVIQAALRRFRYIACDETPTT
jgi:hypothetical protein